MVNTQTFIGKIVGLAIIVLVICAAALPAIMQAQNEQITSYNNTAQTYNVVKATDAVVISYAAGGITVNDYTYETTSPTEIALCDSLSVRYNGSVIEIFDIDQAKYTNLGSTNTVTLSNGAYTITTSGEDVTGTYEGQLLALSENGSYGAFSSLSTDSPLYVNKDTVIQAAIYTNAPIRATVTGTYDDLNIISACTYTTQWTSIPAEDVNASIQNQYVKDVDGVAYAISSTFMDVEYNGSTTAYSAIWFAPIAYDALSDEDSMYRALIGMIPLLLILVAVVYAARMINASKN